MQDWNLFMTCVERQNWVWFMFFRLHFFLVPLYSGRLPYNLCLVVFCLLWKNVEGVDRKQNMEIMDDLDLFSIFFVMFWKLWNKYLKEFHPFNIWNTRWNTFDLIYDKENNDVIHKLTHNQHIKEDYFIVWQVFHYGTAKNILKIKGRLYLLLDG